LSPNLFARNFIPGYFTGVQQQQLSVVSGDTGGLGGGDAMDYSITKITFSK